MIMKLDKVLCCMFLFSVFSLTVYEPLFLTITKVLPLLIGRASNVLLKSSIIYDFMRNHDRDAVWMPALSQHKFFRF